MNTLIAIIGLGVLCLLFKLIKKAIVPVTIIGLLAVLGLSEFNSQNPITIT
jgi:NADH-quinone oxidoreductase subunit N